MYSRPPVHAKPARETGKDYTVEYNRALEEHQSLALKIQELIIETDLLRAEIRETEEYQFLPRKVPLSPHKRCRRNAKAIQRFFECYCGKSYGSEGSLNQHVKLKHSTDY